MVTVKTMLVGLCNRPLTSPLDPVTRSGIRCGFLESGVMIRGGLVR